jgi:type II secretory pathway predicted ATPase ExeA
VSNAKAVDSIRLLSQTKTGNVRNYDFACVLNGYETLRERSELNEFKKRVLRRIFGPKRDEVTRA